MTSLVRQLPSDNQQLLLTADFPQFTPEVLFDYWTKPELMRLWWPQEAQVEPRVNGTYHLSWKQDGRHLRGRFTQFERGRRLAFTWKWDREQESLTKTVEIVFAPRDGGGTDLTLTHGPYREKPEDQELRTKQHLAGWIHFLPKLQALTPEAS